MAQEAQQVLGFGFLAFESTSTTNDSYQLESLVGLVAN